MSAALLIYLLIGLVLVALSFGVSGRPSDVSRGEYLVVLVGTIVVWPIFVAYMANHMRNHLRERKKS